MQDKVFYLPIQEMGVLAVIGLRAKELLQGQLTCHLDHITPTQSKLSALCNPQGRIISFFRLVYYADKYFLFMPRSIIVNTIHTLKKFAPFYKVDLKDTSDDWRIWGIINNSSMDVLPEKVGQDEVRDMDNALLIRAYGQKQRYLLLEYLPIKTNPQKNILDSLEETKIHSWHHIDILEKFPQIYPATVEKFLPHELHLHELNAISFDKGCYTGQEIIARMHYRGKLKTNLQTGRVHAPFHPQIGLDVYDEHQQVTGTIVDYYQLENNIFDLLYITRSQKNIFLDINLTFPLSNCK